MSEATRGERGAAAATPRLDPRSGLQRVTARRGLTMALAGRMGPSGREEATGGRAERGLRQFFHSLGSP